MPTDIELLIDHYAEGVDATIRVRDETKELYFTDPNGIRMQLQDVRYRGGVGPLGDRDPR